MDTNKKIFKSIVFFAIFMIIFIYIGEKFEEISYKFPYSKKNYQYTISKNSIDGVVLGSSVIQRSVLCLELYNNTNIKLLPMAESAETFNVTYYKLKELYKYQNPKVLIVDLYMASKNQEFHEDFRFSINLMRLNFNKVMAVYSMDCSLDKKIEFLFETLYYHNNWKKILNTELKENIANKYSDSIVRNSFCITSIIHSIEKEEYSYSKLIDGIEILSLNELNRYIETYVSTYVEKIIKLAKKHDSVIIFTALPKKEEYWESYCLEVLRKKYEHDKSVKFLNLSQILTDIDYSMDFSDEHHLNYLGAKKVTKYMASYLKENFRFEQNQVDKKVWDDSYEEYKKFLINDLLVDSKDKNMLGNFEDVFVEKY